MKNPLIAHSPRGARAAKTFLLTAAAALWLAATTLAQTQPPTAPPPAPVPPTPPPVVEPPPTPPADLPDAKKILEDSITPLGDKEKVDALKSASVKASLTIPQGDLQMEVKSMRDGAFHIARSVSTIPNSESTVVYDGKHAWVHSPMGYELVEESELEGGKQEFLTLFPYWFLFNPQASFKSFLTVDRTDFNNESCYKVELITEGKPDQKAFAFYDADEKILRGLRFVNESPYGAITTDLNFTDWKEVDGVKVFTKVGLEQGVPMQPPQKLDLSYADLEFNKVESTVFDQPAEVKELIKQRETAPAPGAEPTPTPPDAPKEIPPPPPPAPAPPPTTPPTEPGAGTRP